MFRVSVELGILVATLEDADGQSKMGTAIRISVDTMRPFPVPVTYVS